VIRAAVVDDQHLVREGFTAILGAQPDIEVVVQAENGRQFLDSIARVKTDVVLLDLRMPGMDGLETLRQMQTLPSSPRVLVVTTFDHDQLALEAIAAGAHGYLLKRCTGRDLVAAVKTVASGESALSPEITSAVLAHIRSDSPAGRADLSRYTLTGRETDVLALIGAGLNNTEIAARLHLSMSTVKTHVTSILAKTASRDRVQAALLAVRAGL
jgi:DNA-binding NarL/FixJ family response regulator